MANGRKKAEIANRATLVNGGMYAAIIPAMRKQMKGMLVVASSNGNTLVINGGEFLGGVKDGTAISTDEFNRLQPFGVMCIHNPKFDAEGNISVR